MSDEVEAPEAPPEAPAPEPVAPIADPEAVEEAEFAALEASAIEIPEGPMVPLAAVTKARDEAKKYKEGARRATELEQQLAQVRADLDASRPFVEAAKTMLQAPQPQQQPAPQGPSAEETAELEEVARDLDFYKDGALDLERAGRHQARVLKAAQKMAAAHVAPIHQQAEISKAQAVFADLKAWQDPVTKEKADPEIMRELWNKVGNQPGGMAALANKESAMFIWERAYNLTRWQKAQSAPAAAPVAAPAPLGAPVFTEHSGGSGEPAVLSAMERRYARESGMSDAEYLKAAKNTPKGM